MNHPACLSSFALALIGVVSVRAAETTVTILAGDFDRRGSIVTFITKPALPTVAELKGPKGESVPVQTDASGVSTFIEFNLPHGTSRTYQVIPRQDSPAGVVAKKSGEVLELTAEGKPIFHYQMAPGPVPEGVPAHFAHGAHLHPVFSPSGKIVTGNHPPDHRWHRGIWFAWTDTDFEGRHPDFWNMAKEKAGKLTGEVRFDMLERSWSGPVHGGFASRHRFIDHTGGKEKDVLRETWQVTAFLPAAGPKAAFLFDFVSIQECAGKESLKLPKYHYGGLGVRGNAAWDPVDKVTMLTSEGRDRKAGDSSKGRWVHMGGSVAGTPTGMTVLIHPDNFRAPQPLRLNPKNPQLCIAPSQDGDWEISAGKPYVSRYRFVVADGLPDANELDRLWNDYAQAPTVEVK